ncbi:Hypothetical protein CINCED_3A007706 [Cinara cedri]|uniref:Uncharacterized protein n=1 Tax=Cinara cedri TaxID=506608 RepID=A0A5E4NQK2_9HEMI|nr:Hypothetical protein CINCED_3A007706 [Cinara cedri]
MSWSEDRAVDAAHWQILRNHLKPKVWPTSRNMLKYKQELDVARHADLNQLASTIQEMKNKLSYLKKTASDVNKIKAVGFENFRKDIKTFESKLTKLKEGSTKKGSGIFLLKSIYNKLFCPRLREENHKQSALIEEIDRVKKLTLHDEGSKSHNVTIGKKNKESKIVKRVPISKNTYCSKEIADFHGFCSRNYGLTGGWTSKDHETFLKIRSKHYADGVNFIDHVVQAMPHITEDAAREHENWFVKFEELKTRQKEAIMKWKNEKKNVVQFDCNPNNYDVIKKYSESSADGDAKIVGKKSDNNLEKETNENHDNDECERVVIETIAPKHSNVDDKLSLKRYREMDKKYMESKKTNKKKFDSERTSDPITIVTLHGKSEKYNGNIIDPSEKLPNVHFRIYGTHNQDVEVVFKYQ